MSPEDYTLRHEIAQQLEAANRLPEAIHTYEEITHIKTVPPTMMISFRLKLAALYEKNGQKANALTQYREALKADPRNAVATEAIKRLGG
jgi:Flp pilus assembly protein TadD